MDLTKLTTGDLQKISRLLERKETLLAEVAGIDRTLEGFEAGRPITAAPARRGRPPKEKAAAPARRRRKRGGRGQLKEQIIEQLKAAGKEGIHVKDLANNLRINDANVRVWFYSTGKKIKNVKQVGPARYRWEE